MGEIVHDHDMNDVGLRCVGGSVAGFLASPVVGLFGGLGGL